MATYHSHEPHVHEHPPVVYSDPAPRTSDPGGGLAGYALVKYGFMLVMTIVILYFLARFILPMF